MMTSTLKAIETGKYAKRVALLAPANGGSILHDKIEKELVDAINLGCYTKAMVSINVEVYTKFGTNFFLTRGMQEKNFWMFAKDFGEISPIVAALVEIHEDSLGLI